MSILYIIYPMVTVNWYLASLDQVIFFFFLVLRLKLCTSGSFQKPDFKCCQCSARKIFFFFYSSSKLEHAEK